MPLVRICGGGARRLASLLQTVCGVLRRRSSPEARPVAARAALSSARCAATSAIEAAWRPTSLKFRVNFRSEDRSAPHRHCRPHLDRRGRRDRGAGMESLDGKPKPMKPDHYRSEGLWSRCVSDSCVRSDGPGSGRRLPSEHADALRSRNAPVAIPRGDFPACDPWRGENPRGISALGGCRLDHPLVAAAADEYERRTRSRRAESAVVGRSQARRCVRGSCDTRKLSTALPDGLRYREPLSALGIGNCELIQWPVSSQRGEPASGRRALRGGPV